MANTKWGGTGVRHIKTKNIRYEDGEWWYVGQADGRRRVKAHENKNNTSLLDFNVRCKDSYNNFPTYSLVKILIEPKNSLIIQNQELFKLE